MYSDRSMETVDLRDFQEMGDRSLYDRSEKFKPFKD